MDPYSNSRSSMEFFYSWTMDCSGVITWVFFRLNVTGFINLPMRVLLNWCVLMDIMHINLYLNTLSDLV